MGTNNGRKTENIGDLGDFRDQGWKLLILLLSIFNWSDSDLCHMSHMMTRKCSLVSGQDRKERECGEDIASFYYTCQMDCFTPYCFSFTSNFRKQP